MLIGGALGWKCSLLVNEGTCENGNSADCSGNVFPRPRAAICGSALLAVPIPYGPVVVRVTSSLMIPP